MARRNGFSLVELIVVAGLFSLLFLGISTSIIFHQRQMNSLQNRFAQDLDHTLFMDRLRALLTGSNIEAHAFMGNVSSDTSIVRLPLPNHCVDLAESCPGSTAFLVAGKKRPSGVTSAVCSLPVAGGRLNLILNMPNVVADLSLKTQELLLAISAQHGLVVEVSNSPTPFDPKYDLATNTYGDAQFASNSDCLEFSKPGDKLFSLEVKPWVLPQTGSNQPSRKRFSQELGKMPLLITNAIVHSAGKSATEESAKLATCETSTGSLTCTNNFVSMDSVHDIDFIQMFRIPFSGSTNLQMFGFHANSCGASLDCLKIPFNYPYEYATAGENYFTLLPSAFTLIKQSHLASLFVRINQDRIINEKPEAIDREFYVSLF